MVAVPNLQNLMTPSRNHFQPRPQPGVAFYKNPSPHTWVSYSGQDIRAYIQICGKLEWLANLYTLSYSSFRDIVPVRGLGQAAALAHARGWRTVAGSMVFTQFNKDALFDYISTTAHDRNASGWFPLWVDQIPPFNIIVLCQGEVRRDVYSADWADLMKSDKVEEDSPQSRLIIHKVTIAGGGGTMSVDDMITEGMYNYHALGITPLMDVNDGTLNGSPMLTGEDGARLLSEAKATALQAAAEAAKGDAKIPSMPSTSSAVTPPIDTARNAAATPPTTPAAKNEATAPSVPYELVDPPPVYNPGNKATSQQVQAAQDQIALENADGSVIKLDSQLLGTLGNASPSEILAGSKESQAIMDSLQQKLDSGYTPPSTFETLIPSAGASPLTAVVTPSNQPGDKQQARAAIDTKYGTANALPVVTPLGQIGNDTQKYDVHLVRPQ